MKLREVSSEYDIPEQIVSNNGSQFVSAEFAQFCRVNGVKHIRVSPYHRSFNGLGEHFVQTLKKAMQRGVKDGLPFKVHLAKLLAVIPHYSPWDNRCPSVQAVHGMFPSYPIGYAMSTHSSSIG